MTASGRYETKVPTFVNSIRIMDNVAACASYSLNNECLYIPRPEWPAFSKFVRTFADRSEWGTPTLYSDSFSAELTSRGIEISLHKGRLVIPKTEIKSFFDLVSEAVQKKIEEAEE